MMTTPAEAKERHGKALLRLPNVIGLGVGPKMVHGKPTPVMALKVYVSRKVPKEQLKRDKCVPEDIEGVPTDVEEQTPLRAY